MAPRFTVLDACVASFDTVFRPLFAVILTPQHAKRLMKALIDNISKYEDQYGEIADVDPNKGVPINFGGPTAQA